jgi:hypothetical protein
MQVRRYAHKQITDRHRHDDEYKELNDEKHKRNVAPESKIFHVYCSFVESL